MSVVKGGRIYDYAAECMDCRIINTFTSEEKRAAWLEEHQNHETDLYLRGRT